MRSERVDRAYGSCECDVERQRVDVHVERVQRVEGGDVADGRVHRDDRIGIDLMREKSDGVQRRERLWLSQAWSEKFAYRVSRRQCDEESLEVV